MSTYINTKMGGYADTMSLPGDPLRAKYIAENFLENAKRVNLVWNAFGYTGEYKGHRISVQGSGMGIPLMLIYTNELAREFGVKTITRIGSCGGIAPDAYVCDVLLVQGSSADSAVTVNTFGSGLHYAPLADFKLLDTAYRVAGKLGIETKVGDIFAADRFYNDELDMEKLCDYETLGTETEPAGFYLLAAKLHFRALSASTVSDLIFGDEKATAEGRERTFDDMINTPLGTATAGK